MLQKVEVVPHNPDWLGQFVIEAANIAAVLGREVVAVHHIGSTAIAGISAKPIIDILVEVYEIGKIDAFNEGMIDTGYEPLGENGLPGRRYFIKGGDLHRSHNVHAFQTGDPEVTRCLNFRDYLIAHPEEARFYSQLKEALAREFPTDLEKYMAGKDAFIKEMIRRAETWRQASSAKPSR